MIKRLRDLPQDVREQVAEAIRDRESGLIDDISEALAQDHGLDAEAARGSAGAWLSLLLQTLESGELDSTDAVLNQICHFSRPLAVRAFVRAMDRSERL